MVLGSIQFSSAKGGLSGVILIVWDVVSDCSCERGRDVVSVLLPPDDCPPCSEMDKMWPVGSACFLVCGVFSAFCFLFPLLCFTDFLAVSVFG